jgi:hypothetical protein
MGWTTFASRGRATVDILKDEINGENEHGKWEWLDHAQRGNVVYAVVRKTPKGESSDTTYACEADGSYRFILVVLTSRKGEPGYDFGYKDITETMGPVEKDCPERLLQLASAFRDDYQGYGRAWRESCRQKRRAEAGVTSKRPKPGDTFRTLRPVSFRDGTTHSEFTCVMVQGRGRKRTAYAAKGSGLFYSFRPETFGFEIVSWRSNGEGRP